MLQPTPEETTHRDNVVEQVQARASSISKIAFGEPGFSGTVGEFRYEFDSEEDLLHLAVTRVNDEELSPEQGQAVVHFLFPTLEPALFWLKPGIHSQHFYFGSLD